MSDNPNNVKKTSRKWYHGMLLITVSVFLLLSACGETQKTADNKGLGFLFEEEEDSFWGDEGTGEEDSFWGDGGTGEEDSFWDIFWEEEEDGSSWEDEEAEYSAEYAGGTATVMLYIIGSDLETQGGCATSDIYEICNANLGSNVNVIIQTGGAAYWHNEWVSADTVQRFVVKDGELKLQDDIGLVSMVESDTLTDFVRWGAERFPADRMGLILWDHGGGSVIGFGADEYFEGELDLSDMADALDASDVHFDFIGFDACLMGTIETAYMLTPYADYMIASEELEPGTGWYYTDWLEYLSKNPMVSMKKLGEQIVEDYLYGPDSSFWDDTTLSIVDLKKIPALYESLCAYMAQGRYAMINYNAYQQISYARGDAKSYGYGEYEQIDIADYVEKSDLDGAKEVLAALEDAVVYHDSTIIDTNGLAMYFPYDYPFYYENMLAEMDSIGMEDDSYHGFFRDFINILVYGQCCNVRAKSPMEKLTGYTETETEENYEDASWYEAEVAEEYFSDTQPETLESEELELVEKGENYVLQLPEEKWDTITYIDMWVYMDDGEGYVDLGSDNVYDFDEDGALIVDFDNTWVALDGQIVPFYAEAEGERLDGSWYTYGYVPAELTHASDGSKQDIDILLYWDEAHEDGYVTGYRLYSEEELDVAERNIMQLQPGDKLDFICDFYTYDGEYESSYYFGDTMTVGETPVVSYEEVGDDPCDVCFYLKDVYRNEYWTETVTFY